MPFKHYYLPVFVLLVLLAIAIPLVLVVKFADGHEPSVFTRPIKKANPVIWACGGYRLTDSPPVTHEQEHRYRQCIIGQHEDAGTTVSEKIDRPQKTPAD